MPTKIVRKIGSLLSTQLPFNHESQVVYFLVQIRKVLEIDRSTFPLLQFYADWAVHTKKSKISLAIKDAMEQIHKEILAYKKTPTILNGDPKLIKFTNMFEFRTELDAFLTKHQLDDDLIVGDNWIAFQGLLAEALTDQPIERPCTGILSFSYLPAAKGCALGEIEFINDSGQQETYRFGGAY